MAIDAAKLQVSNRFIVEIDGLIVAGFTNCSGLKADIEPYDYRDVTGTLYRLPNRVKWSNVTLKRGFDTDRVLYNWVMQSTLGPPQHRFVTIILFSEIVGQSRWQLSDAYPISWSFPELNTTANSVAVETLVLAHGGLTFNGA